MGDIHPAMEDLVNAKEDSFITKLLLVIQNGTYPNGFSKADKLALRKRSKFVILLLSVRWVELEVFKR